MKKFREKFRVESVRLKGYDYSRPGYYFVTICTKGFRSDFGAIVNNQFFFSESGEMVETVWRNIPEQFTIIQLDEFIVMPDHLHGIIRIKHSGQERKNQDQKDKNVLSFSEEIIEDPEHSLKGGVTGKFNPMLTDHSLSKIVRWFKGTSTFYIHRRIDKTFAWHPRFFDRIVRDSQDLERTRQYIKDNPRNGTHNHRDDNLSGNLRD